MLNLSVDVRSNVPIYVQITHGIQHKIATGDLKPGDQLPTVRQVAADLRVNFNTVARAYRQLDETGIISTQLGRGTFILEQVSPEQVEKLRRDDLQQLTRRYLLDVFDLRFSPDDLQAVLGADLAAWRSDGIPPPL
jgi:GntR family transcriptional regulator